MERGEMIMARMLPLYTFICVSFIVVYTIDLGATHQNNLPAMPLLHQAVFKRDIKAVYGYLLKGANPDQIDDCGRTAAHAAAENGYIEIIELLASKGANFTIKNKWGKAPLDAALSNNYLAIVCFILDKSTLKKPSKTTIDNSNVKLLTNSFAALQLSKK